MEQNVARTNGSKNFAIAPGSDESIIETLLTLVNNINQPEPGPELQPQKSLLFAIRQLEGENWDGVGPELRMEHIGHVLLLAESLN